jgi:hypothetical protein
MGDQQELPLVYSTFESTVFTALLQPHQCLFSYKSSEDLFPTEASPRISPLLLSFSFFLMVLGFELRA